MKSLFVALTLIASVTLTHANITGVSLYVSPSSDMTCTYNWSAGYPLSVIGSQSGTAAATLYGSVTTDSPLDPTLVITESISNSTLATWSDYHVTISMPTNFSFSNVSVTTPGGWTSTVTQPGPSNIGSLDFNALSSSGYITPGETLAYAFSITFNGPVNFTETAMPSVVPEPSAVGMGAVGGLLMLIARARRNR